MTISVDDGVIAGLSDRYFEEVSSILDRIRTEEVESIGRAARLVAEQVRSDRLVHVYGPGGHSNLAAQEVFFRAGGLMHVSAILDEGTLLSNGASRSMAMERLPGYGRLVIDEWELGEEDLLILVNAYGINSALIDAAMAARERGTTVIGVSSRGHAEGTPLDHPARHPSHRNIHDLVDVAVDTKVPVGDAVITVDGVSERIGAVSTFANAYAMQLIMMGAVAMLAESGTDVPIWRSGNATGGDDVSKRHRGRFRTRVRLL